jgi:uncharacterized protein YjbJ (UPF0337 family)
MNPDTSEGKWKQVVGRVKSSWAELTDDDVKKAEGGKDKLIGVLQERYGKTKEDARKAVEDFMDKNEF